MGCKGIEAMDCAAFVVRHMALSADGTDGAGVGNLRLQSHKPERRYASCQGMPSSCRAACRLRAVLPVVPSIVRRTRLFGSTSTTWLALRVVRHIVFVLCLSIGAG